MAYLGTCEVCGRSVRSAHIDRDGRHKAVVRTTGWGEEYDRCGGIILDGTGVPLNFAGCLQCDACERNGKAEDLKDGTCPECGHFGCWRVAHPEASA